MNNKTLALPWEYTQQGIIYGKANRDAEAACICDVCVDNFSDAGAKEKERGEFIVHACNNYHTMFAALDAVFTWWCNTPDFQNGEDPIPALVFEKMRDAVIKARTI